MPTSHGSSVTSNTSIMLRTTTWALRTSGLIALVVTVTTNHSRDSHPALEYTAVIVTALVMAWWLFNDRSLERRQRITPLLPGALALITVTSGIASITHGGGPLIFLGFMATISAGAELSVLTGWVVAGIGILAVECTCLALGSSTWTVLGYPLVLLVGLLLGRNRRAYRVQVEQSAVLLANIEELREEQRRVATLDERNRIAREIHDVLAHSLGALGVQIQAARAVLTDQHDIERTVELLDQAQRLASDGLSETRRAVHALRSDTAPLASGLSDLVETHQLRYGTPTSFQLNGDERQLSPEVTLAFTRAAQEALVNAAKHAAHQPVDVRLDFGAREVTLVIDNEQTVTDGATDVTVASVDGGYGLAGMRERLLLLDGTLTAGAHDGHWVVMARVPK
jgi:signal transduction histidine kinase